jgi:ABC-type antimicrobial peptide transport system ATPase subunit
MASGVEESEKLASLRVLQAQISDPDMFTDEERSAVQEQIDTQRQQVQETFDTHYKEMLARLHEQEQRLSKRRAILSGSDAIRTNEGLCKLFATEQAKLENSMLELVAECEALEKQRNACA